LIGGEDIVSVVAGCSLFDGVLLTADCRVTVIRGHSRVYTDNVQKVFGVLPHTAVGFVGDCGAAAFILPHLFNQASRIRKKNSATDLIRWMPRLFRRAYSDYNPKNRKKDSISFMAAAVEVGKPNVVRRKAVVDLIEDIVRGRTAISRTWMPCFLFEFLRIDSRFEYVSLPKTSRGLLYVMRSPDFEPEHFEPLQFVAIGSGEGVVEEINAYRDAVLALFPGNSGMEGGQFRDAVQRFIHRHDTETVGGLFPAVKISARGTEALEYGIEIPVGGTKIRLDYNGRRWIQRNVSTGKTAPLLFPWELNADKVRTDMKFDDLKDAFRRFKSGDVPERDR